MKRGGKIYIYISRSFSVSPLDNTAYEGVEEREWEETKDNGEPIAIRPGGKGVGEEERVGGEKRTKAGRVGQRSLLSAYALFVFAPRERELDAYVCLRVAVRVTRTNNDRPE